MLNKAKELLYNSSMSIARIAESTGFQDAGPFIRAFKRKKIFLRYNNIP